MASPTDPLSATEVAPDAPSPERTSVDESQPRVAGRYELLGMLGAGAMGTVYRARDVELDEIVALKVLKKELAASSGMLERFKREVKLARRVTHKNVARTYDIGEHGGDRFLTMEYVEGEMLAARLARVGRLGARDVVALGLDVTSGLTAAHEAGVLHRDLKPENVIVARKDGRAVITDFGIARAFADGEARRTSGMLVGTPAYMAPEQVEGAQDLDERTDLYALGAMLFELLTGVLPFQADSVLAMAAARLLRPAPDARSLVASIPAPLADVVAKLLARRREDRFASARELSAALERLGVLETSTSTAPAHAPVVRSSHGRTMAVLPLLNVGAEEDAYLARVLTEDLVDLLSMIPELRVRPRGDTASFQDASRDVREIGRALAVDVVVDGSVRRIGETVRVALRLVTVSDGFQLWAKRFDRTPSDVLGVADAAAAAVARALTTRDVDTMRVAAVDARAQDLYLRGRYLLHRAWYEVSRDAVVLLREARERAPDDPRITGTLALALARSIGMDRTSPELVREVRALAESALRLAPDQAEAHVARGLLHIYQGEASAAAMELHLALDRAPNNVDALDALGRIVVELGRIEEGKEMLSRALAIEPDFAGLRNHRARARALLGDWEGADGDLAVMPDHPGDIAPFLLMKARLLLWRRAKDEAASLAEQAIEATISPYARDGILGMLRVARLTSLSPADLAQIEGALPVGAEQTPRRASFNAQTRAEMLLVSGGEEEALRMLEVADANGLFDLAWLDHLPLLDGLRDRPEFVRVRASVAVRAARALEALDR